MRRKRALTQLSGYLLAALLLCGALLGPRAAGFAGEPPDPVPDASIWPGDTGEPGMPESSGEDRPEPDPNPEPSAQEPAPDPSREEELPSAQESVPDEQSGPSAFEGVQPLPGELDSEESEASGEEEPSDPDPDAAPDAAPETLYLSDSEVVVYTFDALRELAEADNGVTTFHLGANIDFAAPGAVIHPNKQDVVFDGSNPIDGPERVYKVVDVNSAEFTHTVRMTGQLAVQRTLTVRNMEIEGRNYYPPFCVQADSFNVDMYYDNVLYEGAQFAHNRRGLVHIRNCDVTIRRLGVSAPQELAEATWVHFAGDNRADLTGSDTRAIFFETADGEIVFEEGSLLDLTMARRDLSFVYSGNSNTCTVELERGATFLFRNLGRFNECEITSLVVGEGALFDARISDYPSDVVAIVRGDITVQEGGVFRIQAEASLNTDRNLLRLTGDLHVRPGGSFQLVAEQGCRHLMAVLGGGQLHFEDPKSVLFYNPNSNAGAKLFVFYATPGSFLVEAQQVNHWSAPQRYESSPGGLDDPPGSGWRRAGGELFTVEASVGGSETPTYTALSSNYAEGDAPGYAPDDASFSLANARMMAFGRIELDAGPLYETALLLPGEVDHALAAVRMTASTPEEDYLEEGRADEAGRFELELLDTLPAGTEVLVRANRYGLTDDLLLTVLPSNISFTVPDTLRFGRLPLSGASRYAPREEVLRVTVVDTRGPGGGWRLFARLEEPLTPQNPALPPLRDALVFVDPQGKPQTLSEEGGVQVAAYTTQTQDETVHVEWEPDRGIVLRIPAGEGFVGQAYTGVIHWSLVDGP